MQGMYRRQSIKNNVGPSTEPCGIPHTTRPTVTVQIGGKQWNRNKTVYRSSLLSKWGTQLNPLDKSQNTIVTYTLSRVENKTIVGRPHDFQRFSMYKIW